MKNKKEQKKKSDEPTQQTSTPKSRDAVDFREGSKIVTAFSMEDGSSRSSIGTGGMPG